MAVKYIPFSPDPLEGQALLDNFVRTKRVLNYRNYEQVSENIQRGMPLYEVDTQERIGTNPNHNMVIRGECLSACAYLKDKGIQVDLVYIDPPFASGADYAKKVYVRRNPKVAEEDIAKAEEVNVEEMKSFEEKMYGDIWDKESYLNWMYENLMAIKSVMSEEASIYVHLDSHIGHYVKVLMDEIFGEDNFQREIIWDIQVLSGFKTIAPNWVRGHDNIFFYTKSNVKTFNKLKQPHTKEYLESFNKIDENGRYYMVAHGTTRYRDEVEPKGKPYGDVWNDIMSFQQQPTSDEKVDYTTQKPSSLLERIIKASSNEEMVVADFFGGSGVTAIAANKLNRKFIHCDIGINSIQVVRDSLIKENAEFDILEVKDGVSLYRNPTQTMDKLKSMISGLRNEDALDKFWAGSIVDTKNGMMPVYLPNLKDSSTRILDRTLMNHIIREALPNLPHDTKRVIVYYIDITDKQEIDDFIKEENNLTTIEIELRDLKQVLDNVVIEDEAEWKVSETHDEIFSGWQVELLSFHSDRVLRKIEEFNLKGNQQVLHQQAKGKNKKFIPIVISDEGLETIEWVSLDCTNAQKEAIWQSEKEIKIDGFGYVIEDGIKTQNLWNAIIRCDNKPLRMKIRNICGDESVFVL